MVLVAFEFESESELDAEEDEERRRRWGGGLCEDSSGEASRSWARG